MFYEESHINSCLKCKLCHKRLDKPNILPCGGIICTFCVLSINMTQNAFECPLCRSGHIYPKNGLPLCEPLVEILCTKPVEVQRSASFKLKQIKLNEMLKKIEHFRLKHKDGTVHIKDYCFDLRNKLKSSFDWSQEQLNQMYQDLNDQINQFEMSSIQVYENDKSLKDDFIARVYETEKLIKQFDSNSNCYSGNGSSGGESTSDLMDMDELCQIIDREILKLNKIVFKDNILKFEKSSAPKTKLENSLLGHLAFETNF